MRRSAPRFLPLLLAAALAAGAPALAQKKKPEERTNVLPPAPPQPVGQALRVKRGSRLEIPLRIYGRQGERVRFLLRTRPERGRLSEPEQVANDSATVTYTPPADLAVTREKFTYAAGNALGVSAAAEVTIAILDDPPLLAVPDTIEFPAVLAGATAAKELEISNAGGGLTEGEVQVDPPWRIEGSTAYRLGAGERKSFTVTFAPTTPGELRREARYTSRRDVTTALRAECLAVIAVAPAAVELRHEPGDTTRRAGFMLANRTDDERTLTLAGGDRLKLPATVTLAGREKKLIDLEMAPTDVAALRDELRIDGAGATIRVPVRAAAVGPVLRTARPSISFGRIAPGANGSAALELENAGGTEGFWRWEIPPPFAADLTETRLAPGEKTRVALWLRSAAPGRYRTPAKVSGEDQALEILLEADVAGAGTAAGSAAAQRPRIQRVASRSTASSTRTESGSGARDREAERPVLTSLHAGDVALRSAARRLQVRLVERSATRVVLGWPASAVPTEDYTVQLRRLSLDSDRALKIDWATIPTVRIRAENGQILAEINRLDPGTAHTLRVVAGRGDASAPLFIADLTTPAKTTLRGIFTPLRLLLFLLLALGGFVAWKKWRR